MCDAAADEEEVGRGMKEEEVGRGMKEEVPPMSRTTDDESTSSARPRGRRSTPQPRRCASPSERPTVRMLYDMLLTKALLELRGLRDWLLLSEEDENEKVGEDEGRRRKASRSA